MPVPVSVVTAKFEDLVAVGLKFLIREDPYLELVDADVPIEGLDESIVAHEPDVVVLDLGSLKSPAQVHQLHQAHPATRIMVLANRPTPGECNQMLAFGATACLGKEVEGRDVINAVHLASRGMHVLPRSAAVTGPGRSGPAGAKVLTARESEVLELLQDGASNAQIAHQLTIGVETVRTHARHIYRKLGIASRRDLR